MEFRGAQNFFEHWRKEIAFEARFRTLPYFVVERALRRRENHAEASSVADAFAGVGRKFTQRFAVSDERLRDDSRLRIRFLIFPGDFGIIPEASARFKARSDGP